MSKTPCPRRERVIETILAVLSILLFPRTAHAHGEQAFLFFDVIILFVVGLFIFLRSFRIMQKLLLFMLYLASHALCWAAIYENALPYRTLGHVIGVFVKDPGTISMIIFLGFMYIIPIAITIVGWWTFLRAKSLAYTKKT